MKNTQSLCIDFGSAYTKVALRTNSNASAELIREIPLALSDSTFCVPSVVNRVERAGRSVEWQVGKAAAEQAREPGITPYRHWKKILLSAQPAKEFIEVGVIFFKKLKNDLRAMGLGVDIDACPVRICIPRLPVAEVAGERILDILSQAGWGQRVETVYEPASNAIGFFTRGSNEICQPEIPRSTRYHPNYRRMFDPDGPYGEFRAGALAGKKWIRYGVLVIDVGAFTTDFGYIEFDESFYDDAVKRPDIIQISRELGISELDKSVTKQLRPQVQEAIGRLGLTLWESGKELLYNGNPWAVLIPKAGMVTVGEGAEAKTIANTIKSFAERVVQAKDEFCREHIKGHIDAEVLTGGGSMIPLIRKTMKEKAVARFFDLQDPNRPSQVRRWKDGAWGWYAAEKEIEMQQSENHLLVRGGSAMGACSVFFD